MAGIISVWMSSSSSSKRPTRSGIGLTTASGPAWTVAVSDGIAGATGVRVAVAVAEAIGAGEAVSVDTASGLAGLDVVTDG